MKKKTTLKKQGRPALPESERKVGLNIRFSPETLARIERILKKKPYSYRRSHFIEEAVKVAVLKAEKEH